MKLSIEEIKNLIPHRDPFLFVDTCEIIIPGEDAKSGINNWETDFPEALFDLSSDVRELDNRLNDNLEKAAFLKQQLAVFQKELE